MNSDLAAFAISWSAPGRRGGDVTPTTGEMASICDARLAVWSLPVKRLRYSTARSTFTGWLLEMDGLGIDQMWVVPNMEPWSPLPSGTVGKSKTPGWKSFGTTSPHSLSSQQPT